MYLYTWPRINTDRTPVANLSLRGIVLLTCLDTTYTGHLSQPAEKSELSLLLRIRTQVSSYMLNFW